MNTANNTPGIEELKAKTILLSQGGNIYTNRDVLTFDVKDRHGEIRQRQITAIHYTPGQYGGYFLYFNGIDGYCRMDECEEKKEVIAYINSRFAFPDGYYGLETMIDRLELRSRNLGFISEHGDLEESDFEMIERYREIIRKAHEFNGGKPVPVPGDIIEGAYYDGKFPFKSGCLELNIFGTKEYSVCAQPYVPFIHESDNHYGFGLSVSGGPFFGMDADDLECIGEDTRMFCDWGHAGACGNGAVDFPVKVSRWRVKDNVKY